MSFSNHLRAVLATVGQAAAEVDCQVVEYREFVSVHRCETESMWGFHACFPYYNELAVLYVVARFRVESRLIAEDKHLCEQDLAGLQRIYLPSEEAVEYVLGLWRVPLEVLAEPSQTEIPI